MRIGMDFRPALRPRSGIGRYTASLAAALARHDGLDLRLFGVFFRGNERARRQGPDGARLVAWPVPSRAMDFLGRTGLLPADRAVGGCDLFHHTNYIFSVVSPRVPQVMTVHDLAFLRDPSFHAPRATRALTRVVTRATETCRAFLVPSETTAEDCVRFLGVPRERIFVTPLGVEPWLCDVPPPPPGPPFLLAVGTIEPRKNHARLFEAFSRLRHPSAELHVAGGRGWLCDGVLERARGRIVLHGHVDDAKLRALYSRATAVLYPSLHEGFGLPVVEGMAAGRAVLTSDRPPMRDVAGGAALLVDPEDADSIAAGLARLIEDGALRDDLARKGRQRARSFSWDACAEATARAYAAVLA